MTQAANKKMVVAQCNPYNAKSHYNGQRVLDYDMTTPVKWVMDDDYGYGLSEEEALAKLEAYASEDGYEYFDEESLAEYVKMVKEGFEVEDVDTSWYEGRGYYDMENMYCAYSCGDHYYRHDTMFYSIEDFVAEEKPKQLVVRKVSTGYIYEYVDSIEEGESLISEMEAEDKECGIYEENCYEVAEVDVE
jgi:hypothetical protein